MEETRLEELRSIASEVRKDIVRMVGVARSGPIETPLSLADLFVYLYWEELIVLPGRHHRNDRDRFVLGIGEATPALYAVLARRGFFDREELWHYRRLGAMLQALPDFRRTPGIDAPCVETGTTLSVASALSQALGNTDTSPRVFCLIGWDSFDLEDFIAGIRSIPSGKNCRLVVIILTPRSCEGGELNERADEFSVCGWDVAFANGNDFVDIEMCFTAVGSEYSRPCAIFLTTDGARSLSFVSGANGPQTMNLEEMDQALEELEEKSDAK